MAKDRERKLLDAIGITEEELPGDHEPSKEEREFNEIIKEALASHRIPIECIEYIQVSEDMAIKTVIAKEC